MSDKTPKEELKLSAKILTQKKLVQVFKDIERLGNKENKFCFLLGAGASKSSGIPTGWELSLDWYKTLKEVLEPDELKELEAKPNFSKDTVGMFYSDLYRLRYESNPQLGHDEFKKLMEDKKPSIGYVILSQILDQLNHNFVITTNFDYLVEDAVRMYTESKPFVAGHEMLAEFVSSQTDRPTIIKVHRDLFLNPFNNDEETKQLKKEWGKALTPILNNFNLLVLGYGGNDGSLMDYLNDIEPEKRKPIYWCVTDKTKPLNDDINKLLTDKDFLVEIEDFDGLMLDLNSALHFTILNEIKDSNEHPLVTQARKRIDKLYEIQTEYILNRKNKPKNNKEINIRSTKFSGALDYLFESILESDIDKKELIIKEGIEKHPGNSDLINQYAIFLKNIRKDYDKAEAYYLKAIEANPKYDKALYNYANLLYSIRKDYDKKETILKEGIEYYPDNKYLYNEYAIFLHSIRKDYDKAEEYYLKAIEANPKAANVLENYALLLEDIRKDYDKAEAYYLKAIEANPKDENALGNYALLLENIRKDYDKAEAYYLKAIEANPKYDKVLGNYALFLENIRKDYDKAEGYYLKAIEVNPKNEYVLGNYASFLLLVKEDFLGAESYIDRAFDLTNENTPLDLLAELWFYRYAHYPEWRNQAEKELDDLVKNQAKSIGWNFEEHIPIAKKNKHPNLEKLELFADFFGK